jgi:hypothetical protein
VQTDLGNGTAAKFGVEKAPTTVEESVAGIIEQVRLLSSHYRHHISSISSKGTNNGKRGIRLINLRGRRHLANLSGSTVMQFLGEI